MFGADDRKVDVNAAQMTAERGRSEHDEVLEAAPQIWPQVLGYDSPICFLEPEQIPRIAEGLLELGYPQKDVRGILGENFLRVAEQVWK